MTPGWLLTYIILAMIGIIAIGCIGVMISGLIMQVREEYWKHRVYVAELKNKAGKP